MKISLKYHLCKIQLRFRLYVYVCFCFVSHTAIAATTSTHSNPFLPSSINQLWEARMVAFDRGDAAAANDLLEEIVFIKQQSGWPDFPLIAAALLKEAHISKSLGDKQRTLDIIETAVQLNPHNPVVIMAYAAARWRMADMKGSLLMLFEVLRLHWQEPPLRIGRLFYFEVSLFLACIATTVLFGMVMLYRYSTLLRHALRHMLSLSKQTQSVQSIILSVVIILPIVCHCGPLWVGLIWIMLCAPFLQQQERIAAATLVMLLLIGSISAPHILRYATFAGSKHEDMYWALRDIDSHFSPHINMHQEIPCHEAYLMGLRSRWSHDILQARQWLEKSQLTCRQDAAFWTLLGNVRYEQGDFMDALSAYQKALLFDKKNPWALFNMAQVFLSQKNSSKAHGLYSQIKPNMLNNFLKIIQQKKRITIDPDYSSGFFSVLLSDFHNATTHQVHWIWRMVAGVVPRFMCFLLLPIFMIWLFINYFYKYITPAFNMYYCDICNGVCCVACKSISPVDPLCCHECKSDEENTSTRISREIYSHYVWLKKIRIQYLSGFLMVGSSQFMRGHTYLGIVLAMTFFVPFINILLTYFFDIQLLSSYLVLNDMWFVLYGIFAFLVYVVSIVDTQHEVC